jgi:hypothetical protein
MVDKPISPITFQHAGARGFGGGVEAEQDAMEEVIGEAADVVIRRHPAVLLAATDITFRGHSDRPLGSFTSIRPE